MRLRFALILLSFISLNNVIASNRCNGIQLAGDDLLVVVDGKVVKRNLSTGDQAELFNLEGYSQFQNGAIYNAVVKSSDDVWFSCGRSGVAHYDGEKVELSNSVGASQTSQCRFLKQDRNGTLWAALGYGGFSKYENGEWTNVYEYRGASIYSSYYVTGLVFDSENKMWWSANPQREGFGYCTNEAGWYVVSDEADFYNQYGSLIFNSLAIDSGDNKWLGVNGSSIMKYGVDGSALLFSLFDEFHDGDNKNPVFDIQIGPDGRIWAANGNSVYAFTNKDDIESIEIPFPEKGVIITCFKHEGDGIWIGTYAHGLFHWQGDQLESINLSAGVSDIIADEIVDRDAPLCDIMGRKVDHVEPGNLYIRGGHKFIAR